MKPPGRSGRVPRIIGRRKLAALLPLVLAVSPLGAQSSSPIAAAEHALDSLRYLRDQLDVSRSRAATASLHGTSVTTLLQHYEAFRPWVLAELDLARRRRLTAADSAALETMRRIVESSLGPDRGLSSVATPRPARCDRTDARQLDSLQAQMFGCYSVAARAVLVDGDTLDRLSVLSMLGTTRDRARRERLFRALEPIWSAVNGHDEAESPYRRVLPLRRAAWEAIEPSHSPMADRARDLGLDPSLVERWLEQALEAWRSLLPDTLLEPWDYYYHLGALSRRLEARIPRDSLLAINHRFYRMVGADPVRLNIQYDLEPRAGKYPIAFTTFGARSVRQGGRWSRGEPWVFASYRLGGFDNLAELLHETGHGVHIAAIRERPAYHDWPDSDTFTEGVAELAWFDLYEPAWQRRLFGLVVPLAESMRAKYAGIMLDMAWALFEFRVHRADAPTPNQVWAEIGKRYLGIMPHPELSWWAMRGQLIESPGYMLNYALGAFLVADLRDAAARRLGPAAEVKPGWYRWASASLFRFGAAVPAREVVRRVLGRPISPKALLEDLARGR